MLYKIEQDWFEKYCKQYPDRERQVRYATGLLARSQRVDSFHKIVWNTVQFEKFNSFIAKKKISSNSVKAVKNQIAHLTRWLEKKYGVDLNYPIKKNWTGNTIHLSAGIRKILKKTRSPLIKIFCSYLGKMNIPLKAVTEDKVRNFLGNCGKRGSYRNFAKHWNRLHKAKCVPQKIPVIAAGRIYLKIDELPAHLEKEIGIFRKWSILDEFEVAGSHKRKEIRPITFKGKRTKLLQYICFLKRVKKIDISKKTLRSLLQVDECMKAIKRGRKENFKWTRIDEFVSFTRERLRLKAESAGMRSDQAGIKYCLDFLKAVSMVLLRDFYGVPENMIINLKEKAQRLSDKHNKYHIKEEYIPILDSTTYRDLQRFENTLWKLYQKEGNKKKKAEIGLVAFIVSLLMRRPFRSRTLRTIRIGRNLTTQKTDTGMSQIFRFFPKENLKCGNDIIEMSVPKIVEPKLNIFLTEARPLLSDSRTEDYLIPGLKGGVMSGTSLHNLLVRWSLKLLGKPLNPHLWRHLYATTRLRRDSSKLYSVSKMLMHTTTAMTQRIYSRYCQTDVEKDIDGLMGEK